MRKAHRHSLVKMMRRTSRVYVNDLNAGKAETLKDFLHLCRDAVAYYVEMFWRAGDFSADLADLETVYRACERFGITTRLSQALAKQAKEMVRSAHAQGKRKPEVRKHTITLYCHFVTIEPFEGHFDWAVHLIGSGAPRMVIPVKSTAHLNRFLSDGWQMAKTIRLGRDHKKRLFIDFILENPRPPLRSEGEVVGLDSNYKQGIVLSDGQTVGQRVYERIRTFTKRQKQTKAEIKSLIGHALKQVDLTAVRILCVEHLKHVRQGTRGKFPRVLNRRLSHWLYGHIVDWLARRCEALGIWLERKNPAYTSITCSICNTCDKRSRVGERFVCRHCGFSCDADLNAALNLKRLGEAGAYGLRSLKSWSCA